MKKLLAILLVCGMFLGAFACTAPAGDSANTDTGDAGNVPDKTDSSSDAEEKTKVALLLTGNITDAGWNAAAYDGLVEAEQKFDLDATYVESIQLAEYESYLRDYAVKGYDLIICHSSDFVDAVANIAPEYPDVKFAVSNGSIKLDNAIGMDVKNHEQGYMMGFALALISKTGKVGYVGSVEMLAMTRAEAGFKQGVAAANPEVEALVAYTGSGDDAAKGKETALAMFDKGADGVANYANASGLGAIQAAQEQSKYVAVTNVSQVELAPDQTIISVQPMMRANILSVIEAYINGNFGPDLSIVGGFDTGLYEITYLNESLFTAEQIQRINDEVAKLQKGEVVVKDSLD